jgi:hypothetical protein
LGQGLLKWGQGLVNEGVGAGLLNKRVGTKAIQ